MGAPASALWFLVYGAFRVPFFPSLTKEQQAQRGLVAAGCHTAAEWQKPKVISAQSVWGRVPAAKSENAGLGPGCLRLDQEPELPRCLVPRPRGCGSAASPARVRGGSSLGGSSLPSFCQSTTARPGTRGPVSPGWPLLGWQLRGLGWSRELEETGSFQRKGWGGGGGRGRDVTEGHGGPAPTPNSILAIRCDLHNDPSWYSEEAKAQRGWPCS